MSDMQANRRWIIGAVVVGLVVVTAALFPTDCLIRMRVAAGEINSRSVTTCQTLSGLEWPGMFIGIAALVGMDLPLLALAVALRKYPGGRSSRT